jgi:hypothetical protein
MSPSPYPVGGQDFGKTFGGSVKQEEDHANLDTPPNCMQAHVLI